MAITAWGRGRARGKIHAADPDYPRMSLCGSHTCVPLVSVMLDIVDCKSCRKIIERRKAKS